MNDPNRASPTNDPEPRDGTASGPASGHDLRGASRASSLWAIVGSVVNKVIGVVAQVAFGWFLTADEIGVAGLAISVSALAIFFNPPLMSDILLRRGHSLDRDGPPAFWSTFLTALLTCAFGIAVTPALVHLYDSPALFWPTLVCMARPILATVQLLPLTAIRLGLGFRAMTSATISVTIGSTLVGIALAALGAGPFALIVPALIQFPMLARAWSKATQTRIVPPFTLTHAGSTFREYTVLSAGQYAHTASMFVDYAVVGFFASKAELGIYFFAFQLSGFINSIVAYNVGIALQPVLVHLAHDPQRQGREYLRVFSGITALAVPLCVLQAALAVVGLRLVFADRWVMAAPVLAVLSIANIASSAAGPTTALLKAQGRFKTYVLWQTTQTVLFIPSLAIAAAWLGPLLGRTWGGPAPVALAVSLVVLLQLWISHPIGAWIALRGTEGRLTGILRAYGVPLAASLPGSVVVVLLQDLFPPTQLGAVGAVPVLSIIFLGLYAASLRLLAPQLYGVLMNNGLAVLRRILRRRPPAATQE